MPLPLLWLTIITVVDSQTLARCTILNWWSVKSENLFCVKLAPTEEQFYWGEETPAEMFIEIMKTARSWFLSNQDPNDWLCRPSRTRVLLEGYTARKIMKTFKSGRLLGDGGLSERKISSLWEWFKRLYDWLMEQLFKLPIFENSLKRLWRVL